MSAGWTIRPMTESDVDTVMAAAAASISAPHWRRADYAKVLDETAVPARVGLVAEAESGELAGFVVASMMLPEAELESIVVTKAFQRRGVGLELVRALCDALRSRAVSTVHLEVRASNRAALALYAAAGFTRSGMRPRYYADPVEDGILFSLNLG
ncbi:MAG TPA: ribosomal protein S18-alanine N-acetyltransferase [Terracidiphilus sp.]|nr:ribosomal protein S18-alanine N-acetyltransferase [Terracidiphilus sp.]